MAVYCVDCKKKFGLFDYRTETTTGIKGKICAKCNEKRYLKKANKERNEELNKNKKSSSNKVKNVITKPKSNNMKVLVISEEIHNELEKARLEAQDNDEKKYDLSSFLKKLLKEHKTD